MGILKRGKDPNRWTIRYQEPGRPGEPRHDIWKRFHGTEKEAKAEYARLLKNIKRGVTTGNRGRTLFATFAQEWLADRREQILLRPDDTLSPYTVKIDESRVRQHLIPTFGHYRIEQISPKEIDVAVRRWKQTPLKRGGAGMLSPKSISNLYVVLRKMLNDAVRWNYIEWNPCDRCDPPPGGTRKVLATPLADAAKLIAYPSLAPVHVCSVTALFTGLRRGELLALQREDVDLERGTVWCEKAIATWEGAVVTKAVKTKNERGRRMQPLAPFVLTLLRAYVDANPGMKGPLFAARGQAEQWSDVRWTPRGYSAAEARHMTKVGIVASAQTLRHAFNSLQNAAGVDLALRAVLMGHSNSNLTETTYQTVWMDQKRAAVAALEGLILGSKQLPEVDWKEAPPFRG
jgi:integrase